MSPPLPTLDLFSGIGGFSLGLESTGGFQTVAFCEISPKCRFLLNYHWPNVPCFDDVRTLKGADVGEVEVICGGFPCQDISFAGRGAGLAGERSGLWSEYARLIGELRPRFVIVENVSALLVRGMGTVVGDLAALGYDAWWDCIPASAVGAPHRRDRLWIVAYAGSVEHQGFGDALGRSITTELHAANTYSEGEPDCTFYDEVGLASAAVAHASRRGNGCDGQGPVEVACHSAAVLADSARLQPGRPQQRAKRERIGAGGEPVALGDAHGSRLPSARLAGAVGESDGRVKSRPAIDRAGWWLTEPDVGRVADGVPAQLDGVHGAVQEHDTQARAEGLGGREVLPSVRSDGQAGATPPLIRRARQDRGSMPALPREGGPSGWDAQGEATEGVRNLRDRVPADAQPEALALQPGLPRRSRPETCPQAVGWAVEPNVPRVARDVPARVDRLHGLGNAVIPQIPALIGRAILAAVETSPRDGPTRNSKTKKPSGAPT